MVKVPLVLLLAIVMVAGTVAAAVLLLVRLMINPGTGAGPVSVTVPTEFLPLTTVGRLSVNDKGSASLTLTAVVKDAPPLAAVIFAELSAATD